MTKAKGLMGVVLAGLLSTLATGVPAVAEDASVESLNSWHYPAPKVDSEWREYEGWTVGVGGQYYAVDDDEGRFRQDRFIDDDLTGGIEVLTYKDEHLDLTIRAVVEDLYGASAHYVRPDMFRVDLDFSRYRRYFDGSNEPWDPTLYGLTGDAAELEDDELYVDRVFFDLSATLLVPDLPNVTVGWNRQERFGNEVLLRGGTARAAGLPRFMGIPVVNDVDGVSNTLYVDVPFTLQDQYNIRFRQEYERYDDDQVAVTPAFNNGGFEENMVVDDDLEWEQWRTLLSFDTFLTDAVYLSAAYYYSDLKNNSDREVRRPGPAPSGGRTFHFIDSDTANDERSNIFTLGLVFLNLAPDLQLNTSVRLEHTDRDGDHTGQETPFFGVLSPLRNASSQEETRVGENLTLVYKAVRNTTVTLEGEWEQRFMDLEEFHQLGAGAPELRDADIDYENQEYTLTVVNRPRRALRLTGQYRLADDEQDYDSNVDPDPVGYPDWLGDIEKDVHEVTLKADWQFLPLWTLTGRYQYALEEIETDVADTDSQDLTVNRVSATLFGIPVAKLTVTAMGAYEDYELDTPGNIPAGSAAAVGTSAYDFEYENYILMVGGSYAISEQWSANLSYQHTESTGDADNSLDEIWLGADYLLAEDKIIKARYEYFNFEDDLGDGFDDYDGHGVYVSLAYRF